MTPSQREELQLGRLTACPRCCAGPAHQGRHGHNDIVSHLDFFPRSSRCGVPDVKEQLVKGMKVGDTTTKCISTATICAAADGQTT